MNEGVEVGDAAWMAEFLMWGDWADDEALLCGKNAHRSTWRGKRNSVSHTLNFKCWDVHCSG